jgi:hypothetical protein
MQKRQTFSRHYKGLIAGKVIANFVQKPSNRFFVGMKSFFEGKYENIFEDDLSGLAY